MKDKIGGRANKAAEIGCSFVVTKLWLECKLKSQKKLSRKIVKLRLRKLLVS